MGMYNLIEEVSANVVNITTGGIQKNYNKTDLKVSKTDQQVFVYYYTDGTNKTVASWNEFQAQEYGYTLSELKSRIDGILVSTAPSFSGLNISNVPEYANQTDAIADGLKDGDVYRLPKASNNRLLAVVFAIIESYSFGESTIGFVPDGSNGWDVSALVAPTAFENLPGNLPVDSTHFNIEYWSGGTQTTIYDSDIVSDHTENTGANGAGVYYVAVTYNFSDGTAFVVYGFFLVDTTNTILKSVVINGITVNSVNGLVMDVTLNVVQTNCSLDFVVVGLNSDSTNYYIGNTIDGAITLQPLTQYLVFMPNLDSSFTNDYDGDATQTQAIIIS